MRILLIDDESVLGAVGSMMRSWGGQVDCVSSARIGMLRLAEKQYDYILLDLRMPGENGIWFLKHADIPSHTRVVAMSAFVPGLLLQQLFRYGACDFLEKPFTRQQLLEVLDRHRKPRCAGDLSRNAA